VAKSKTPAKRHRQSLKRRATNYAYRSRLRTQVKNARLAISEGTEDKDAKVIIACRELDRMVTKGVLHKNAAARSKSRLIQAMNKK
jgi:small subunit ribosomal protein S20